MVRSLRLLRVYAWLACGIAGAAYGCHASDVCLGQDIDGSSGCDQTLGFAVSECNLCKQIVGCECVGSDCADIFPTKNECDDFVGDAECHCK